MSQLSESHAEHRSLQAELGEVQALLEQAKAAKQPQQTGFSTQAGNFCVAKRRSHACEHVQPGPVLCRRWPTVLSSLRIS